MGLGREMAVVFVCQAHLAAAADFGDGVDGGADFGVDGGEDVLEGEGFERGEVVGGGGGFLFAFHFGWFGGFCGGGFGVGVGADEDGLGGGGGSGVGGGEVVFVGGSGAV